MCHMSQNSQVSYLNCLNQKVDIQILGHLVAHNDRDIWSEVAELL